MEIQMKQYGMMTLVSLGVGAGYLFSAVSTFIPALSTEFYLEISTLIWVLLFGHFLEAKSSTAAGDALQEYRAGKQDGIKGSAIPGRRLPGLIRKERISPANNDSRGSSLQNLIPAS